MILEKALLPLILLDFYRCKKLGFKDFTVCKRTTCFLERITRSPLVCALSLFYTFMAQTLKIDKRDRGLKSDHLGCFY